MKWLQWSPDRNAILGTCIALIIIVIVFEVIVTYFPNFQQRSADVGFGPDWNCAPQAQGDPICIRKMGR